MMKILKWAGLFFAGALILLIAAVLGLIVAGTVRLNQTHHVEAESIDIAADQAVLARGEHLVNVFCEGCHSKDLRGSQVVEDPMLGTINASNITGVAQDFSDEELIVAIRHGIDRNGRYLMIMPVDSHIYFSEDDLGAIIAYLKTIPQSGTTQETRKLRLIGQMLVGIGAVDMLFPAAAVDHDLSFPEMPEIGANAKYGEYLARHCQGCHGANLAGGTPPDPASPPAPNLTPIGLLGSYTEEDFITTLRTGITPYGHTLQSAMPWESFAKLDDSELRALWIYLSSLDPLAAAGNEQ